MNLPAMRVMVVAGVIIVLVITSTLLLGAHSEGTLPEVVGYNQVTEQQISQFDNSTATITITMTGVED